MLLIEYPKCSTCQKAHKYLLDNNKVFDTRHIVNEPLNENELKDILSKSGKDINKLFNTSGLKYRALNLKDKLPSMSEEEKIKLLSTDGMLVKRPILITDNKVLIGFKEVEYKEI